MAPPSVKVRVAVDAMLRSATVFPLSKMFAARSYDLLRKITFSLRKIVIFKLCHAEIQRKRQKLIEKLSACVA